MTAIAVGPDANPFRQFHIGDPPVLAMWIFTLFPFYIMTWMTFTLFVELKAKTGVLVSAFVAAALFGGFGLFLSSNPNHVFRWVDLLPFIAGGAVYGVTYWLVSLRRKQRRLQT